MNITQNRLDCPDSGRGFAKNSRCRKRAHSTRRTSLLQSARFATEVSELVTPNMQLFLQYSCRQLASSKLELIDVSCTAEINCMSIFSVTVHSPSMFIEWTILNT